MDKMFFLCVTFILVSSSCFSQETKIQNYICLNESQSKTLMHEKGYQLKTPDTWCFYKGFHNILMLSPKALLSLKGNYYKNNLYVSSYDNDTFRSNDIEEALKKHFVLLNGDSQFTPVFDTNSHEIYGKYYIVKRKSIQNGEKLMNLEILYNYKNRDYIIRYSVLERDFNANLNDVIPIMESFKIVN
jgi:hypothetical protein